MRTGEKGGERRMKEREEGGRRGEDGGERRGKKNEGEGRRNKYAHNMFTYLILL